MDFRSKQISPPADWTQFEALCHALFKRVWGDPQASLHGRRGQPQHGVDVWGQVYNMFQGVQCKGKDANYGAALTNKELLAELGKAEGFTPPLASWTMVTTAPNDEALQKAARLLSAERVAKGQFPVRVMGWEDVKALMDDHREVAAQFYGEHVYDVGDVLKRLQVVQPAVSQEGAWAPVTFGRSRDLGPALMGRALGPGDAAVCPRLVEADALARQLTTAFSARLYGSPGAGKSVCAMQAALTFVRRGASVFQLLNPASRVVSLPEHHRPSLYVIDDAHLMPPGTLDMLERQAGPQAMVLSTLNDPELVHLPAGATVLDAKRAVATIAEGLRKDRDGTLKAVRSADDDVGDSLRGQPLERRIDAAEQTAERPWQFCFILGGGWRRATQAADRARLAHADIVLAAVALRQITMFDARSVPDDIATVCAPEGISGADALKALAWLVKQRLVISLDDCRTPHQRFAAVVLHRIIIGQSLEGRQSIFRMAERILADPTYPMIGLARFLNDFQHPPENWSWNRVFSADTLNKVAERCWAAGPGEERRDACILLVALWSYTNDWIGYIRPNVALLGRWISDPGTAGYGLGLLVNDIMNADKDLVREVTIAADPHALAAALSRTEETTFFGCSELVDRIHYAPEDWKEAFRKGLDRSRLLTYAAQADTLEKGYLAVNAIVAIAHIDEDFALDMADAFVPQATALLRKDLLRAFSNTDDLFQQVLWVLDVLGVYVGKLAPTSRRVALARRIFAGLTPAVIADQLGRMERRDLQQIAMFLVCLRRCSPRKAAAVIAVFPWQALERALGDTWSDLDHDSIVLLGILTSWKGNRSAVSDFVTAHAEQIGVYPPRLAVIAQDVFLAHVAAGRPAPLVRYEHVDWTFGPFQVALLAELRPDLLPSFLAPSLNGIARSFSRGNASWYGNAAPLIGQLQQHAPAFFDDVLAKVDVAEARAGWRDCLKKKGDARQTVALLVDRAVHLGGGVGAMANEMRLAFPAASRPRPGTRLFPSR